MYVWDISFNPVYGDCYYVARSRSTQNWSVGYFRLSAGPIDAIYLDISLPSPVWIQAISADRRAGFLLGPTENGEILRYDANARLIGRLDGFGSYLEFALE